MVFCLQQTIYLRVFHDLKFIGFVSKTVELKEGLMVPKFILQNYRNPYMFYYLILRSRFCLPYHH